MRCHSMPSNGVQVGWDTHHTYAGGQPWFILTLSTRSSGSQAGSEELSQLPALQWRALAELLAGCPTGLGRDLFW